MTDKTFLLGMLGIGVAALAGIVIIANWVS